MAVRMMTVGVIMAMGMVVSVNMPLRMGHEAAFQNR
jgi:hypothetical protein